MSNIYIDLETIPTQLPLADELIDVKPPGNITKAETLAKWEEETRPEKEAEAKSKLALDGLSNHIIAFGVAIDNYKPTVLMPNKIEDEADCINEALTHIKNMCGDFGNIWIGHNIINFDLSVIKKRCIILGIKPPLKIPFDSKPWDDAVYDTMLKWDAKNYTSQDKICKALGIECKSEMDGSMVYDYWRQGKRDEIREYCAEDVYAMREIHKRMNKIV